MRLAGTKVKSEASEKPLKFQVPKVRVEFSEASPETPYSGTKNRRM